MRERNKAKARRRGAVLVEYTLLLTLIAIPSMMGIAAGGAAMLKDYTRARDQLLMPFP
jgi:Flp pilus assembly pilin Flp